LLYQLIKSGTLFGAIGTVKNNPNSVFNQNSNHIFASMEVVFKGKASGKLMLTGEYLALCGAKSLALPTQLGQSMLVSTQPGQNFLQWKAYLPNKSIWFEATFLLPTMRTITCTDDKSAEIIATLLKCSNYKFKRDTSYTIETQLDFDPSWGLGSSSTLIANIANFTKANAFSLLEKSFGGSGYDIAVSLANKALIFQKNATPQWETIDYQPAFYDDVLFIYSGTKRISSEAIKDFESSKINEDLINEVNDITDAFLIASGIAELEALIDAHENFISKIIGNQPIKSTLFSDYSGSIKSLGAWGGDFFLATRKEEAKKYFSDKGYTIMFEWNELIKQ
jgi:mevalonate kinase